LHHPRTPASGGHLQIAIEGLMEVNGSVLYICGGADYLKNIEKAYNISDEIKWKDDNEGGWKIK
jgi:prolyl-tRNA synthetase